MGQEELNITSCTKAKHKIIRIEVPRDIGKHQRQAVTCEERVVRERGLTVAPFENEQVSQRRASNISKIAKGRGLKVGRFSQDDNDTLREVPHWSDEGLALQARVSGPWPHEKESVLQVKLALLARCKNKLLWTECNAQR